jgi:glutamate dehydrogenase
MQKLNHKQEFDKFIKATARCLPENASADTKALVVQFYDKIPVIDLDNLDPKEAAKIVISTYDFIKTRKKHTPKIRITPKRMQTIIEILNDDMPFLVDSVAAELGRQGMKIHQIIHPIIHLKRDKSGSIDEVAGSEDAKTGFSAESFIRIEASRLQERDQEERLEADLLRILGNVRLTVNDWSAMRAKAHAQS